MIFFVSKCKHTWLPSKTRESGCFQALPVPQSRAGSPAQPLIRPPRPTVHMVGGTCPLFHGHRLAKTLRSRCASGKPAPTGPESQGLLSGSQEAADLKLRSARPAVHCCSGQSLRSEERVPSRAAARPWEERRLSPHRQAHGEHSHGPPSCQCSGVSDRGSHSDRSRPRPWASEGAWVSVSTSLLSDLSCHLTF